jgi:hypothetical protein
MSIPIKCPLYRLNTISKSGGDFNVVPTGTNFGDYLYWDGTQWKTDSNTIHLGANAGKRNQGKFAVALGQAAGTNYQSTNAVAIGYNAGDQSQGYAAIAIGNSSGVNYQGVNAIAIGQYAGYDTQGNNAIAIGQYAGSQVQGQNAIAIGQNVGGYNQGKNAIAIGQNVGLLNQGENAIAIGQSVGANYQGSYAIAIGQNIGDNQAAESIILNASSDPTPLTANTYGFFVKPIRGPFAASNVLSYDVNTNEIFYNGSSKRFKYDIFDLHEDTSNIYKLQPREFKYNLNDERDIGLIAEEADSCDSWFAYKDQEGTPEGIQWNIITTYLIAEMKQMKKDIETFEMEINIIKQTK